ncbi:MAG: HEAT repeat domain-containing protein [Armatimonas sp.]
MKRRALIGFGGLALAGLLAPLAARSLAPVERTYAVDLTGDSKLSLGATAQRIRFRLKGTLRLTDAGNQKTIGQLERPQVNLWQGDEEKVTESKVLQDSLQTPFVLQKSAEGTIATVAFSPESPEGTRQTLRALLTFSQASPKRQTKETDLAGTCEVAYRSKPDGKWEKQVMRYITAPETMTEHRPEGVQTVAFDSAGGVDTISGTRTLRTLLANREVSVSTLSGSVRQTSRSTKLGQATLPTVGKAEPLSAGPDPEQQQRQRYSATLGAETPDSLLAALESLSTNARAKDSNSLYLKVRALMALQPESASRFDAYLTRTNPDSAGMRVVLDAIREIGTPQAQLCLATAIKARASESGFVEMALPALGMVAHPTKETEAFLLTLSHRSDNCGAQASLLLGTLVNTLSRAEPVRSKALLGELIARLKNDANEPGVLLALAALGNAGAPDTLPQLTSSLSHTNPNRRSAALLALRLIPGAEAEKQLLKALQSDTESSVRASAAFALSFQPRSPSVHEALKTALSDPSKEVVEAVKRAQAALLATKP